MRLALTTIGTGTAMPEPDRGPTCSLLVADDTRAVIDLGSGALQKLAAHGASWLDMDALFLTHAHVDHIADVLPLLFALSIRGVTRQTLPIYASDETHRTLQRLREAIADPPDEVPVRMERVQPGDQIVLPGLRVHVGAVSHSASSVGWRFETHDGRVVAIPGDTGPTPLLDPLCQDADLAVLECGLPDDHAMPSHLTPSSLAEIAARCNIRHLLVTHRYPSVLGVDIPARLATTFRGRVTIPNDGDRFELPERTP